MIQKNGWEIGLKMPYFGEIFLKNIFEAKLAEIIQFSQQKNRVARPTSRMYQQLNNGC